MSATAVVFVASDLIHYILINMCSISAHFVATNHFHCSPPRGNETETETAKTTNEGKKKS